MTVFKIDTSWMGMCGLVNDGRSYSEGNHHIRFRLLVCATVVHTYLRNLLFLFLFHSFTRLTVSVGSYVRDMMDIRVWGF